MRKLFSFNMVTLDGLFEGSKWDLGWHNVDGEFNEFAAAQLNEIGTLLFGRVTYEGMAAYWPTPQALKNDPLLAGLMNRMPKIVFSRTLQKAEWNNTTLVTDQAAEQISELKKGSGKDLAVFGSANLLSELMRANLVDEHRLMVNPVILGAGARLFQTKDTVALKLVKTRAFANGNVLLTYRSDGK
ncbi:MAG TPA: dihydrofolate reductase family protein [Anaerolineales bacterium]|nr:dihydrofolate reductase family protein [Anaerolineales bacterium]